MKNGRTEKVIYTFKIRTLWAGVGQNHTNTICIIPPQLLYLIQRGQKHLAPDLLQTTVIKLNPTHSSKVTKATQTQLST